MAETTFITFALLSFGAWLYLFFFRGNFWRGREVFRGNSPEPRDWPEVAIVVPARNEAATIAAAVSSLAGQRYPGRHKIFLVDDQSADGTAERARMAVASELTLEIIPGSPLPDDWTGKMWAVSQGVDHAIRICPGARYVMLTDADIQHDSDNLRELVA